MLFRSGSVVGAFYAAGISPDEICKEFLKKERTDFMKISIPKSGFFKTKGFINFLEESIPYKNIEDLKIPMRIVSTDFDHGKSVVFTEGKLSERVMASSCVPIVFEPMKIDGIHYVDGGLFKNFPVSTIREDCDFVIGINVSPLEAAYKNNILFIAQQSYEYIFKANTVEDKKQCDILVEIEEALQYKVFDLDSAMEIFQLGYDTMKKALSNKRLQKFRRVSEEK